MFYPDTAEREIIATAMNEYEKDTCITFVPRTEEVDYIVITAGGSGYRSRKKNLCPACLVLYLSCALFIYCRCTSYVGRVGGAQTLSLDPGCVYTLTLLFTNLCMPLASGTNRAELIAMIPVRKRQNSTRKVTKLFIFF